jgi:hypothetical protein
MTEFSKMAESIVTMRKMTEFSKMAEHYNKNG